MKRLSTKRISQRLVAKAAGVTLPVVSVVLSGQSTSIRVSQATRQRVIGAAQKLGYKPRFVPANNWGRAKTKTIVWLGDPLLNENPWLMPATNSFYQKLMHSVVDALDQHQFTLSIKQTNDPQSLLAWLTDSGVEGVLWRSSQSDQRHLLAIARQFPVVAVNRVVQADVDRVCVNQAENASLAAEHLWEHGHRRIAYFGFSSDLTRPRITSYEKFVSERGLSLYPEFRAIPDDPQIDALTKARAILDTWRHMGSARPTALITSDVFALHIFKEAQRRHIHLPAELSIIGIDNLSAGEVSHPALTSMDQHFEELGRRAVEALLHRIADRDRPTQTIQVSPTLVSRESVAHVGD